MSETLSLGARFGRWRALALLVAVVALMSAAVALSVAPAEAHGTADVVTDERQVAALADGFADGQTVASPSAAPCWLDYRYAGSGYDGYQSWIVWAIYEHCPWPWGTRFLGYYVERY